jgi:hypothetical protein
MDRCQRRAAVAGTTASPISGGIPQKSAIFGSDAVRAYRANTVHPLKSQQIPGGINHRDC